jgi:cell wall-associated NlpC family hydrolase
MIKADIVTEARSWIGTPWRHQGRSRDGIDCAGLVILIAQRVGGIDFDKTDYPRQASDETMLALCARFLAPVRELQPGDVAVFAFENQRHIGIVGDYVFGGLSLIHAYALAPRRVVETRLDGKWLARMRGAFRFPEGA